MSNDIEDDDLVMIAIMRHEGQHLRAIIDTGDFSMVYNSVVGRIAAWFYILAESGDAALVNQQRQRLQDEIAGMVNGIITVRKLK